MKRNIILICLVCVPTLFGCELNRKTTIVLVRHGQTVANINHILVGRGLDSELTSLGEAQAAARGKSFESKYHFDSFYCSSLKRTENTGKIILQNMSNQEQISPVVLSGLDDIDYGLATGMTVEEATSTFGGVEFTTNFGAFDDANYSPSFTQENSKAWLTRFESSLNSICEQEKGHTVLVMIHGACYNWGQYRFGEENVLSLANCGFAELEYTLGKLKLNVWSGDSPVIS